MANALRELFDIKFAELTAQPRRRRSGWCTCAQFLPLACWQQEKNMKAIGFKKPLPIDESESLLDIDIAQPEAAGHDLLVEVKAVSVNPVDVKVRARSKPEGSEYKILGWDAAGIVRATGSEVTLYNA